MSSSIEIKTQTEILYTFKILSNNTNTLADEIEKLANANKNKFKYMPIILAIENIDFQANDLAVLVEILTQNSMVAVGIYSKKQELVDFARFSGLVVFDKIKPIKDDKKKIKKPTVKNIVQKSQDKIYRTPKIIDNNFFTAKQIIAKDTDLVLLGNVKRDMQLISFGDILAYKQVDGSLFAGSNGDKKAIIFTKSFNPQLVSIAGIYRRFDVMPDELYNQTVIISLVDDKLKFKIL